MVQLTGHNISYSYTKDRMILKDISFRFRSGEIVSILGPNGAGKTTFLNCLANLVPLDKGEIFIDDKNITKVPPREVAKVIGYVPQIIVPSFDFSVLEYVVTGCAPHMGTLSRPKQEHYDIAMEAIRRMGIEKLTNASEIRSYVKKVNVNV
jgi:iron complex transport system ATP-binding protein